jgi:hypothetical protein
MTHIVILESPYAGDVERNLKYARRALFDSIERDEAPLASHLLYTQVLDDTLPHERKKGMELHMHLIRSAPPLTPIVAYIDYDISPGMMEALHLANEIGLPILFRRIGKNEDN